MRKSITRFFYRFRGILISPLMIFALLSFKNEIEADWLIWPVAISIFLSGLGLRIWAQEHIQRRTRVPRHLVTTGPYSFIRNPLYIGNMLMCLGVTVASELLWLAPVALLWCAGVYSIVVRYEERHLLERYGELYRRYMLKVPRWLPQMLHCRNVGIINKHLGASIAVEIRCLLMLFPYILKEIVSRCFGR